MKIFYTNLHSKKLNGAKNCIWCINSYISRWMDKLISTNSCFCFFFRILYRVSLTVLAPDEVTRTLLYQRKAARRGEKFLVSWSRSTSTSSIYRYQAVNLIFGQISIAHCLYLNTYFLFMWNCFFVSFGSASKCFAWSRVKVHFLFFL